MKMMLYIIIGLIIFGVGFYHFAPVWGAKIDKTDFKKYEYFSSGKFKNQYNTELKINQKALDEAKAEGWFMKMVKPSENREPKKPVKVNELTTNDFKELKENELVWFGHSSFLIKLNGKTLMFDPMFSNRPSPVPILIKERYNKNLVITPEELPELDAVLISHDHYDHLDHETVLKLKEKVKQFIVPVGIDQHLIHWGVEKENITVLEWWENTKIDDIVVNLTPSQHFSGRRLQQNNTLWGSYLLEVNDKKIYFSGDTGYGSHFKDIQSKFGDIDFALLECGQYNPSWADIHMMPEHTVQAAEDLGAKRFMPVHWGMFTLSTHDWTDPVEQAKHFAKEKNIEVNTPEIGEKFSIFEESKTNSWWR